MYKTTWGHSDISCFPAGWLTLGSWPAPTCRPTGSQLPAGEVTIGGRNQQIVFKQSIVGFSNTRRLSFVDDFFGEWLSQHTSNCPVCDLYFQDCLFFTSETSRNCLRSVSWPSQKDTKILLRRTCGETLFDFSCKRSLWRVIYKIEARKFCRILKNHSNWPMKGQQWYLLLVRTTDELIFI